MTVTGDLSFLVFAGLIGGLVNVVAGGSKLFVFPMLLAAGLPPLVANATATVGLWPAQLPGIWVFRRTLAADRHGHVLDAIIAAAGAVTGAVMLFALGEAAFLSIVPGFLVLAAAAILFGDQLSKLGLRLAGRNRAAARVMFLFTGVYAGYFGAGYGFLIVAAVFLAGEGSIHVATARKNFISLGVNTAAVVPLSLTGLVAWDAAITVLISGLAGGTVGGRAMTYLPQRHLRRIIAACGLILAVGFSFRS